MEPGDRCSHQWNLRDKLGWHYPFEFQSRLYHCKVYLYQWTRNQLSSLSLFWVHIPKASGSCACSFEPVPQSTSLSQSMFRESFEDFFIEAFGFRGRLSVEHPFSGWDHRPSHLSCIASVERSDKGRTNSDSKMLQFHMCTKRKICILSFRSLSVKSPL